MGIEHDSSRFKKIIKGQLKKHLKKYASTDELFGKKGNDIVKIPIRRIDIPHFIFGKNKKGIGIGEGEEGDVIAKGDPQDGQQKAGNKEGDHMMEIDMTVDEIADILAEELQLPYLDDKNKKRVIEERIKYSTINKTGPESLRHNKRTFLEAMKRSMTSGKYNPEKPVIIPVHDDRRYKSYKQIIKWATNAAIITIMDVSGSMGANERDVARTLSFWINAWIRRNYEDVKQRWIVHDAKAVEVDEHDFFHTSQSGGTIISSAYELAADIIKSDYPETDWNVYIFHFSDGDNWSNDDSEKTYKIIEELLGRVNMVCYGNINNGYGSGQFGLELEHYFNGNGRVRIGTIKDREDVMKVIKGFFKGGL